MQASQELAVQAPAATTAGGIVVTSPGTPWAVPEREKATHSRNTDTKVEECGGVGARAAITPGYPAVGTTTL